MLALTPMPLQTAGERALFAELARWDTGGAVRGAVVASIPMVTDGPLQRRISDAVLIVPEGIAVMRIVEVERQSGIVTVKPEGAWTIAPGPGPGEVLQLGGGGSTTLDGLMRAGMDAAMRLRRAGLEPGRIARLTVLVGNLTALEPPDGDLGEGDQVALVEPRSLLLGIARASRYAGVDNPRLWTTADVRAALEALGLNGRGPSVEELNGEGFPYSPYVLRRPELLTPAAMTAASTAPPAPPAAPPPGPAQLPPQPQAPSSIPVHVAAAPVQQGPASVDPFAGRPERDTIAVGSAESADDTDGIGGLFASAEPVGPSAPDLPPVPPAGPRTAVLTAPPRWEAQPTAPVEHALVQPAPPTRPGARPGGTSSGKRTALLIGAAVLVLALIAVGGFLVLDGSLGRGGGTAHSTAAGPSMSAPATLAAGSTQQVGGMTFTLQESRTDTTCVGHAYGQVVGFFQSADCTGLSRALYSTQVDGHPLVVAISHVRMPDAASARSLRQLTDSNGTGNVSDLLREGVRYPGGPTALVNSGYRSALHGTVVTIAETSWVIPSSAGDAQLLDTTAQSGLSLAVSPVPGG